jgi:hypothetical protein
MKKKFIPTKELERRHSAWMARAIRIATVLTILMFLALGAIAWYVKAK